MRAFCVRHTAKIVHKRNSTEILSRLFFSFLWLIFSFIVTTRFPKYFIACVSCPPHQYSVAGWFLLLYAFLGNEKFLFIFCNNGFLIFLCHLLLHLYRCTHKGTFLFLSEFYLRSPHFSALTLSSFSEVSPRPFHFFLRYITAFLALLYKLILFALYLCSVAHVKLSSRKSLIFLRARCVLSNPSCVFTALPLFFTPKTRKFCNSLIYV